MDNDNGFGPVDGVSTWPEEERAPWMPNGRQIAAATASMMGARVSGALTSQPEMTAQQHIEAALKLVFPPDTWDDSVEETARRVLGYWQENVPTAEPEFKFTTFQAAKSQLVFVGDIEFTSLCAHHLLPFVGRVHVGYMPGSIQVGLSKIPRLIQWWARRPQVQEQLTAQILGDLKARLQTKDVIVVIEAQHTCVSARGARNHNGVMRTSLPSGLFLSSPPARQEFLALMQRTGV